MGSRLVATVAACVLTIGVDAFAPVLSSRPRDVLAGVARASSGMRPCSLLRRHKTTGSTVPSLRVRPLGMEISGTGMEISATEGLKGSGEGGLVTEDDVEALVIRAEEMWEQALQARKDADDLSSQAEEAAEASQVASEEASQKIDEKSTFSLKLVAEGQKATNASMKASELLAKAAARSEEADKLESEAEGALLLSEMAIEQHLRDFPDVKED